MQGSLRSLECQLAARLDGAEKVARDADRVAAQFQWLVRSLPVELVQHRMRRQAEKHWPMQLQEVRAEEAEQQCLPSVAVGRHAEKHWPMQPREVWAEEAEQQCLPSLAVGRHAEKH